MNNSYNDNNEKQYKTIYSPTTNLYLTRSIKERYWSQAENEYATFPVGTRILAYRDINNHVITKYVVTRTQNEFIRYTIVFREGEEDPYPVDCVYTFT